MSDTPDLFTETIRQPSYGPHGEPFAVVAETAGQVLKEYHWTRGEALDRRDVLLDDGWHQVRVLGLPTIISGGGTM